MLNSFGIQGQHVGGTSRARRSTQQRFTAPQNDAAEVFRAFLGINVPTNGESLSRHP